MEAREVAGRGVAPLSDAWRNDKQVLILRKYFINQMIEKALPARIARTMRGETGTGATRVSASS